jgi:phosphoribosylglycinamide formyltransferase-1
VFISGRGSNLQAALDMGSELDIALVVTSKRQAPGILRARRSGIPTFFFGVKDSWSELTRELQSRGITHIFLAGFLRLIPKEFFETWEGRMVNVHPSLLPAYPGLRSIERSHEDGGAMGVSVHVVTPGMDEGPVLVRRTVLPRSVSGVHPLSLAESEFLVHACEHQLVRKVLPRWNSSPRF